LDAAVLIRDALLRTRLRTAAFVNKRAISAGALEHCERLLCEGALQKAHGNQSQVARLLGITPRSVYTKMHKYQLRPSTDG
jgi:DNA-binding NtrC family response regulator